MRTLLVTGSAGLIGSEVSDFFSHRGWYVHGIDNNMREEFFGRQGSTITMRDRLIGILPRYMHYNVDIRDRKLMAELIKQVRPDAIIHTAAQPSHDRASQIPYVDFDVNAGGTMNLLEGLRQYNTDVPFIHMSTNKVYGDKPNSIQLKENKFRWEFDDNNYLDGIDERFPIDQTTHSLFGASKVAADVMVQEYGRYFDMPTCCLRSGCLTGPNHSGVELHGFLSYLIKCNVIAKEYVIYGYKGKQVRDNIHSYDVARFCEEFINAPRVGEVYNLGGGKGNSISILEAFAMIEDISGLAMKYNYSTQHRTGDHMCYYSDLTKLHNHYPEWRITKSLTVIFKDIFVTLNKRLD